MYLSFFVTLLARLRENGWTDLREIFREGVELPRDDQITFLVNSEKPEGGMEGCIDLAYPAMHRPGIELAISRSRVQRPNVLTITLPRQPLIVDPPHAALLYSVGDLPIPHSSFQRIYRSIIS